ncbi:hypothetical protein COMNV_01614 [Commensalibacter sp. Nvir]|nr:hypothetical protein COMNV_01614 [Commensalibacter sp. Nvir]
MHSFYQGGTVTTGINRFPKGIPKHLCNQFLVMLSAYNPGGRLKPEGWNKRQMGVLADYLVRYEYYEGKGSLNNKSEPLFLVAINPAKAIYLARKFRQNAIVIIRNGRLTKLKYIV